MTNKDFWEEVFKTTEDENKKITKEGLTKSPANILEAQLQSIIWHHLKIKNITSVTELTYDTSNKRKRLDLVLKYEEKYYAVEIKRNCIGLKGYGKNYTDSIDRFQNDLDKLDTAEKIHGYKKIFIVIQYFLKNSLKKHESHAKKFKKFLEKQDNDWRDAEVFEFGGESSIIYQNEDTKDEKDDVCLTMRVVIAKSKPAP